MSSLDLDKYLYSNSANADSERVVSVEQELQKTGTANQEADTQILDAVAMAKVKAKAQEENKVSSDKEEDMAAGITYQRKVTQTDSRSQTGRKPLDDNITCDIKRFPKSLVQMVKHSFPEVSNTKALAAFVYANRDTDLDIDYSDVSDDVIALANTLDKYKAMRQMDKNIRHINEMLKRLNSASDDTVLALSYLIYDRLGFRTDAPMRPDEVDFTPRGVQDITSVLEIASDKIRKEKQYQEGRPIK